MEPNPREASSWPEIAHLCSLCSEILGLCNEPSVTRHGIVVMKPERRVARDDCTTMSTAFGLLSR